MKMYKVESNSPLQFTVLDIPEDLLMFMSFWHPWLDLEVI